MKQTKELIALQGRDVTHAGPTPEATAWNQQAKQQVLSTWEKVSLIEGCSHVVC